jgi:type IV pilus assembly protein PilQ
LKTSLPHNLSKVCIRYFVLAYLACISLTGHSAGADTTQPSEPPNSMPIEENREHLSLNFQDIKVRAALQIIAEFTGLNLVTTETVNGNLTLSLKNVPWEEALDVILKARGLGKRLYGNILFVAPVEEIATREKQELQAKQQVMDLEPLTSELIQINYGKATEIAGLLKEKGNTVLSTRGNVTVDTRTNNLWIQDTPDKIEEVRQLVQQLDIPVKQVLIEARIVNINKNYERNLGIKFGVSNPNQGISGTLEGGNKMASGLNPSAVPINERLNFNSITKLEGGGTPASIGLALMRLGNGFLLDLELSALESEGGGQVISSPRLLTANQQAASIQSGQDIPYQEKTSSGATSVSFKKAVLSLKVTPQITPDKRIILKLAVNQDKRGLKSQEVQGVPVIETRQIETQVLVNNGQTIVLGGIYEQSENNGVTRVPFFSDLPLIGNLFKNTQTISQKTELLIFVTPKIIEDQQDIDEETLRSQ